MNLQQIFDHLLHTELPAPSETPPSESDSAAALRAAHASLASLEQDIADLDTALTVAEIRLRSRGMQIPRRLKRPNRP